MRGLRELCEVSSVKCKAHVDDYCHSVHFPDSHSVPDWLF